MASRSPRRSRRTASEWREILARHGRSGLSIEAFCARESLSRSSFHRWRERLAVAGAVPGSFVELTAPSVSAPSPWTVELELPAGIVLRVRG
jgi:hypothetical protein